MADPLTRLYPFALLVSFLNLIELSSCFYGYVDTEFLLKLRLLSLTTSESSSPRNPKSWCL